MSFIKSLLGLESLFETRKGIYGCTCGAVQITLTVPPSSHAIIEQTNALCHCKDCISFAIACSGGNVVLQNNATQFVQFFKSDLEVSRGKEYIGSVKLHETTYEASPMARCYCTQCGTPLGADLLVGPVTLLYPQLISSDTFPMFLPRVVLNYASALEGTRPYCRAVSVRRGLGAPWFVINVFGRVILGLLLRKTKGGLLGGDFSTILVGIDKIQIVEGDNKKGK